MASRDDRPVLMMPPGLLASNALRLDQPPIPPPAADDIDVEIIADGAPDSVRLDPATGALETTLDDGSVEVDISPDLGAPDGNDDFNANLALVIDQAELSRLSEELLRGIDADLQSRQEWVDTSAEGIRLLGLKIERPESAGADASTAVAGQSTVRHPLLLEACLRFQANARGELLPAEGPVKVDDKLDETGALDAVAQAFEDDCNYFLTTVATEYYPDTDRALFGTGFRGCSFKKVYNCPIRQRAVSESVDAKDLIVSNASTDMRNSPRVTHQIMMRPSMLRRMQLVGAYRDVELSTPNPQDTNPIDQAISQVQGINPDQMQSEDREYTIYECYCELDIKGFEDKDQSGEPTGLALPYRVVIEKDSRVVLEIRRAWEQDDDRKLRKLPFVKYPFVPGLGFYDIGFVHILGNTTNALTAAWRETLDAYMFANFPGFIYAKGLGRQNTNEFRVAPGGGVGVDVGQAKLGDAIMPLPYKQPDQGFVNFQTGIAEMAARLGGTAEMNVGEGQQNAPVGTTLALIEQATKVEGAVHKRLHAAQAEEFALLKECFRENPQGFIASVKRKGSIDWEEATFLRALDSAAIVPKADPNTPSHLHRIMKAMGMVQLDKAYQGVFNSREIAIRAARMLGVEDVDSLLAPPQAGGPQINPALLEAKTKADLEAQKRAAQQADNIVKLKLQQNESADQAAERENRLRIAEMHLQEAVIDHQDNAEDRAARLAESQPPGA